MRYDIPDEDIVDRFGSLENFIEAEINGDDEFYDFINDYDYDREDDLWTDRKGGYEVEYSFED
jgi:hypothetical protein